MHNAAQIPNKNLPNGNHNVEKYSNTNKQSLQMLHKFTSTK